MGPFVSEANERLRRMGDIRFETTVGDSDELCQVVDIDAIDDIETLLVFIFDRPVALRAMPDEEGRTTAFEVIMHGDDELLSAIHNFPLSAVSLVRSCAETADALGPYDPDTTDEEDSAGAPSVLLMSDEELVTALGQALGKVRLFNMLDEGE